MVLGIGNDIVEIQRIRASITRYSHRFLDRLFTRLEQDYCSNRKDSALHFAGRFAAKEAVVKALGTGFSQGIAWTDIEIVNEQSGKPIVIFSDSLNALLGYPQVLISISHCHSYATAFAIWTSCKN